MKDSYEIEKTIKIQEEELTDLQNNFKLLKNTFEETRKKNKSEWVVEMETANKRRIQEKDNLNRKIAEMQKKVDYLKDFKVTKWVKLDARGAVYQYFGEAERKRGAQ